MTQLKSAITVLEAKRSAFEQEFYKLHMHHNTLQAQKYRLLSKQKRQTVQHGAARQDLLKDELLKLATKES